MFGYEGSCSSSDIGSCTQISYGGRDIIKQEEMGFQSFISNGLEENHKFMLNGGEKVNQLQSAYFGEIPLEYAMEDDVKQVISTSNNNMISTLFNHIDDSKTQEKVMYLY